MNMPLIYESIMHKCEMLGLPIAIVDINAMLKKEKKMDARLLDIIQTVSQFEAAEFYEVTAINTSERIPKTERKSLSVLFDPIVELVSDKHLTTAEICERLGEEPKRISMALTQMKNKGLIDSVRFSRVFKSWFKTGFTCDYIEMRKENEARRKEAKDAGEKTYVGAVCPRCGTKERRVIHDRCIGCDSEYAKNYHHNVIKVKRALK